MTSNAGANPRGTEWNGGDPLRRHEDKMLLVLTLLIGALVGLVVVAFIVVTERLGALLYPAGAAAWRRVVVPAAGALISGVLLYRYFPGARGSGIPQTKTALFLADGRIPLRTVLGKFACSSLSLASGIALGREGPSVQLGAGIASVMARRLGLGALQVKRLVPVGASAALAAAFNTPIAAVLFSLEEVVGDLHASVLGSVVLASATSWMVLHLMLGDEPLFHVPAYQLVHPIEFLAYAFLGIVGGVVSVAFVKLLLALRRRFLAMPRRTVWLQPVAGGLTVGVMGWFVPDVLGVGYGHVGDALNGRMVWAGMGLLLGLKLVATATAYASGNAGGIFGPSLFLGAMLGGLVGSGAHALLPDYTGSVGAYALVGMGAAFAGILRVPMTSVIMIFEITRDYTIIVPLMIANMVSYLISARWQREPIYEALLGQDGISLPPPRHARHEPRPVASVMRTDGVRLAPSDRVADVIARGLADRPGTARGGRDTGPSWVVADGDAFLGVVTARALRLAASEGRGGATLRELLAEAPAGRAAAGPQAVLFEDEPLDSALERLAAAGADALPVVDRTDAGRLLGMVSVDALVQGFASAAGERGEAGAGSRSPRLLLAGVAVATALLMLVIGGLGYYQREERLAGGRRALADGAALLRQGRPLEAVQLLRAAVAATRSTEARLALGDALRSSGHAAEAAVYFREVLRDEATNGPANLGLGRASARAGMIEEALLCYGRAIVGVWPDQAARRRIDARFELVDLLAGHGDANLAVAQLLELEREVPSDEATRNRIGRLLLSLGARQQAADLFRGLAASSPRFAPAQAGLGEADFSRGDYAAALASFRRAISLDPGDAASRDRAVLCEQVIALDPTRRGLAAAERHARSRALLGGALARIEPCAAGASGTEAGAALSILVGSARAVEEKDRRPRSLRDAADRNVELARQLWEAGQRACPTTSGRPDAVDLALARLARE